VALADVVVGSVATLNDAIRGHDAGHVCRARRQRRLKLAVTKRDSGTPSSTPNGMFSTKASFDHLLMDLDRLIPKSQNANLQENDFRQVSFVLTALW